VEGGVVLALARWGNGTDVRAFIGLSGLATAATVLGTSTRNRRALVATLEERAARLDTSATSRTPVGGRRARADRPEMHDIVAHNVSVMIALPTAPATPSATSRPRAGRDAQPARTGRQALTEMRRLLGVLREEDGIGDRSRSPASASSTRSSPRCAAPAARRLRGQRGTGAAAARGLQLAVYRIVQRR